MVVNPMRAGPATLEEGYLMTADVVRVLAYKNLSPNIAWDTDCHGFSIANGKYWINDPNMQKMLNQTVLLGKTTNPQTNDIVVYRYNGPNTSQYHTGDVIHSARYNGGGTVTMAAGTVLFSGSKITTVPIANGWTNTPATIEYWHGQ